MALAKCMNCGENFEPEHSRLDQILAISLFLMMIFTNLSICIALIAVMNLI